MERMAEAVPDSNDQALQHFLTNSPWDEQLVVEQVAHDTNELLGGRKNSCLLLDESGLPKKGKKVRWRFPAMVRTTRKNRKLPGWCLLDAVLW